MKRTTVALYYKSACNPGTFSHDIQTTMTDQGILLQLYRQTHKVAAWKILGLLLRLDKSILDKIERERHRVDDCRLEMLHAWLNSNPKDPFRQMKAALEELQPAITTSEKGKLCVYGKIRL